jgi:peroxiredoxin
LADYRDKVQQFAAAGYGIVALSVDEPQRSAGLRRDEALPFPILCDVNREVVRAWDLFNEREKGGIAVPATFVIDRDRKVRFASVDKVTARVDADGVLAAIRSGQTATRRALRPAFEGMLASVKRAFRYGIRSPRR